MDEVEDPDLEDLPFDVIQKLQQKVGLKKFKEYLKATEQGILGEAEGEPSLEGSALRKRSQEGAAKKKKKSKSAPQETSSRVPVKKARKVVGSAGKARRDPRFDGLSGTFNDGLWKKSYGFLSEKQEAECGEIRKQIKKTKDPEKKEELSRLLQSLRSRLEEQKRAEAKQKVKSERLKAERELVAKGKKPFYLKAADAKGIEALEQFEALKKTGSITKKLAARRKRDASQLRRHLPK